MSTLSDQPSLTDRIEPLYREVQAFRQWWMLLIIALIAATGWSVFVVQILLGKPVGNNPAPDAVVWIIFGFSGVGLPLLLMSMRLVTEVFPTQVRLRFFPIWTRTVSVDDIAAADAVTYRPIREFQGWGIRYRPGWGWAYNVSGNLGVSLDLRGGRHLMIGSRRHTELADTINTVTAARI